MNILDEIVAKTKIRVQSEKKAGLPSGKAAGKMPFIFEDRLHSRHMSFICEIKKASPSKGIISEDFPYLDIAREYEQAGADAISVLTEPGFFQGSPRYLTEVGASVNIPVLRKDFIVDPFQIEQSALLGADAVLLICAVLSQRQLYEYIKLADSFGMSCLVEAHDENEVKAAADSGARIIGVNNRDLKTFKVDRENSIRLRKAAPKDIIFVSESGIKTHEDIALLDENGIDAVLIGETLMRSENRKETLKALKGEV